MFYGRFDAVVDNKWRLRIPLAFIGGLSECFVGISDKNCVIIYPEINSFPHNNYPYFFKIPIKKENRIIIPSQFRDCLTFFYGKEITVAGYGEYLELWPRPAE